MQQLQSFIPSILHPQWQVPKHVCAFTTLKSDEWGLAMQRPQRDLAVGQLTDSFALPNPPLFLKQVHGTTVHSTELVQVYPPPLEGDGWYSNRAKEVLAVLTGDCMPILFCNQAGTEIAAVHGGWRGLAAGILYQTINKFQSKAEELTAWIGPCIGYDAYEVGQEVYDVFSQRLGLNLQTLGLAKPQPEKNQHWFLDLAGIAITELQTLGLPKSQITHANRCTYANPDQFYSHRRSHDQGRHATLIWRQH